MASKIQRVERHIIRKGGYNYLEVKKTCHLSKNLYNYVNYILRQSFFETGQIPGEYEISTQLAKENQDDFRALPAQVSQQTIKLVFKAWKSFFSALKAYKKDKSKFKSNPRPPKYKDKNGYFVTVITNQSSRVKENKIYFSKDTIQPITTKTSTIRQVRLVPSTACFIVEVVYEKDVQVTEKVAGSVAAIDLGLNNFVTFLDNQGNQPFIINGKGIKSYNQNFNKKKAKLQSKLPKNVYSSKQLLQLNFKRNMFIHNFIHQASSIVLKTLLARKIETLVIGYNENWKQNITLGKRTNQHFVQIPYKTFIDKIMYKCEDYGIKVTLTEESYTSKVDHLAGEEMHKHKEYKGKRIHRGLFLSSTGILINADVNGALGIMRKVFSESAKQIADSGVAFTPVIIQPTSYTGAKAQYDRIRIENTKKAS